MSYAIALDIGTSGFRCQAIDLDTGATVATSITDRHPIPGMNVIDHVNYAMKKGEDTANALMDILGSRFTLENTELVDINCMRR